MVRPGKRKGHLTFQLVSREALSAGPARARAEGEEARAGDPQNVQKSRRPPEAVHRFLSESVCREHIHICQTYLVLIKQIMCFVLIDIRSITIIIRRNTYCGFDVICLKLIFVLNRRVSVVR